MRQDEIFARGEANAWFTRNRTRLSPEHVPENDPILEVISRAGLRPAEILEVGAANGYRVASLQGRFGCAATAVDPSEKALADGRARFPGVQFLRGQSHHMPALGDGRFDLVIVHFVLHWVDRSVLLRSAAEIDRVLQDGGHLLIGDFHPDGPERVTYHHLPELDLWTYKQDYAQIWLASLLYEEVANVVFDHATRSVGASVDSAQRARVVLLRKTCAGRHRTAVLPGEAGGRR
jgi:SAM-dependent methyltransferase